MKSEQIVVVDWTRSAGRVGVLSESVHGWQLESELNLAPRLVVRHGQGNALRVLAGEQATEARADANTLIFEQPARDLPHIEDPELQTSLLSGFWSALGQNLVERGLLRFDKQAVGYVVPPHRFPQPLLERFRASCAGDGPLKFSGSVDEAAALVIGFVRSEAFHPEESDRLSDVPIKVGCVVGVEEQMVDVVFFDYTRAARAVHRIVIRDFFQTSCAELSTRLRECDWLGAFSLLVLIEGPALSATAQAALNAPLQALAVGATYERRSLSNASQLKLRGAAHVALCATGYATDEPVYEVSHACHVGMQIDQQHFQPIISKQSWTELAEFPYLAAQAFHLRGMPGNALRLNLYSGYSTMVADAVPLGHTMLWQEDLAQLAGAALTATVRLDAPSSGEFVLGVMPENYILRRQPFTLPGLVN
jgi:hypothetical protein